MKFPSIFRTNSPMRYDIKPRYYDPVKEEIEQRTARIKKELEEEGVLSPEEGSSTPSYGSGIRGSFSQHRGIKPRDTSAVFSTSSLIRTLLFFGMVFLIFGYIYIGPEVFNYMLYLGIMVAGGYFIIRLKKRTKKDE